jgi:hypothetical protein
MTAKDHRIAAKELSPRSYNEYFATWQRIVDTFGKDRRIVTLTATDLENLRAGIPC